MKYTLGEKFRMLREQKGASEVETAKLLKTPLKTYKKIEDDFIYPTENMIHKTAKAYGMKYDELLQFGED